MHDILDPVRAPHDDVEVVEGGVLDVPPLHGIESQLDLR